MATHLRCLNTLIASLAIIACPPSTYAAAPNDDPYFAPLPVVLTVSRLPRPPAEVPAGVTVIDADLIRATGYRDIGRLLRLVPGMQVAQEGGNDQWVSYHGPGTDYPAQVQVLLDGRALSSPYFGGIFAGGQPLAIEDIERIEVVRGTDSASYGSQAFLGIVNIITRHSAEERGNTVSARVGSGGIAGASARIATHSGPLGLRISAQHEHDDGMRGLHDGRRISRANLRSDLQLGPNDELTLASGAADMKRQKGYPNTPLNSNPEREAHSETHFVQLRWRHTPSADEEFILSANYALERSRDEWRVNSRGIPLPPPLGVIEIPVDENGNARRQNIEFEHHFTPAESLRLGWGGEWRRDTYKLPFLWFSDPEQSEEMQRLFGNLEWSFHPAWRLNTGLMAERAQYDRSRLAPRIFLNWLPEATQSWRIGYSRAYRQPSLFDRNADVRIYVPGTTWLLQQRYLPNPEIEPVRIDSYELGFLGQLPYGRATLDVRLFHERIRDQIRSTPVLTITPEPLLHDILGAARWTNRDDVIRIEGVEYQITARPWRGGTVMFSHSMLRARGTDAAIRNSIAPYTASFTVLHESGPWTSALTLLRMGPANVGTGFSPTATYTVPAYTTLDASIAREFLFADTVPLELRLTGLNLLGRHQELANFPRQRTLGEKPGNKLEPQIYLSLSASF